MEAKGQLVVSMRSYLSAVPISRDKGCSSLPGIRVRDTFMGDIYALLLGR